MQKKTINKECARKMDKFLASLPKALAAKVRPSIIITGGAIVSMLSGEDINDWDMYISNREVLKELTQHYLDTFNNSPMREGKGSFSLLDNANKTELAEDGHLTYHQHIIKTDPERLYVFIPSSGIAAEDDKKAYNAMDSDTLTVNSAGMTSEEAAKLPEEDEKQIEFKRKAQEYLKKKYRPIFLTGNAITLSNKVQLIIQFHGSPEEIHKNFDFRAVKSYWTYGTGLITSVDILLDINSKRMVYEGSRYPICSMIRTRKYINRQWKISAGEYVKMAFQVGDLDLKDVNVLKDQLVGVDSTYFTWMLNIIEADKKRAEDAYKPFDITSTYVCELVDLIFNR